MLPAVIVPTVSVKVPISALAVVTCALLTSPNTVPLLSTTVVESGPNTDPYTSPTNSGATILTVAVCVPVVAVPLPCVTNFWKPA